jgi:hypothetical protein
MTKERQGEVALAIVEALARREGPQRMLKHIGRLDKLAELTGFDLNELRTFTELLTTKLVKEWFTK